MASTVTRVVTDRKYPKFVQHIHSGNIFWVNDMWMGSLVVPAVDNVKGWAHVNGKQRQLNEANYVDYDQPITIQN